MLFHPIHDGGTADSSGRSALTVKWTPIGGTDKRADRLTQIWGQLTFRHWDVLMRDTTRYVTSSWLPDSVFRPNLSSNLWAGSIVAAETLSLIGAPGFITSQWLQPGRCVCASSLLLPFLKTIYQLSVTFSYLCKLMFFFNWFWKLLVS